MDLKILRSTLKTFIKDKCKIIVDDNNIKHIISLHKIGIIINGKNQVLYKWIYMSKKSLLSLPGKSRMLLAKTCDIKNCALHYKLKTDVILDEFKRLNYSVLNINEYKNTQSIIKYKCITHNINCQIIYNTFQKGQTNCKLCSKEKSRQTCLKNYGVDNASKSEEIKERKRQTCLEKFGVDNSLKSKEVREKCKQTLLNNYGVDHPMKSEKIKTRMKETFINNYGVDNPFKSEEIKEKIKQTNIQKYGVDNPSKSEEIKKKIKETFIKKYGVDNPFKSKEI